MVTNQSPVLDTVNSNDSDTPHDTQDLSENTPKDASLPLIQSKDLASSVWSINVGKGAEDGTDNSVRTTKYTLITFLPIVRLFGAKFSKVLGSNILLT